jgi:hypothetical protein
MHSEKKTTPKTKSQTSDSGNIIEKNLGRLQQLPAWMVVSIIAILFIILFCLIPFLLIDITNQWCNLFPGFFNSMSPGICP